MGTKETKKEVLRIAKQISAIAKGGKANRMEFNKFVDETIRNGEADQFIQCLTTMYSLDVSQIPGLAEIKATAWERILEKTASPFIDGLKTMYKQKEVYQQGYEIRGTSGALATVEISPTLEESLAVVATASKVSLTNTGETLTLNVLDPQIFNINVFQANWATYSTTPKILANLASYTDNITGSLDSQIPTEQGGTYLVEIEKRSPYGKFLYRVQVGRDDLLGTIVEEENVEFNDPNYYNYSKAVREALGMKRTYLLVDRTDGSKAVFTNYDASLSEEENLLKRYTLAIEYLKS